MFDTENQSRLESGMDHNSLYGKIGSLIRARRKKVLGLTQEELAHLTGISRASIANIETGNQSIFVHQLYSIAEALDMTAADLLPNHIEFMGPEAVRSRLNITDVSDETVGWIEGIRQKGLNG